MRAWGWPSGTQKETKADFFDEAQCKFRLQFLLNEIYKEGGGSPNNLLAIGV